MTTYDDDFLAYLTPEERDELDALLDADMREVIWSPLQGPQSLAYHSKADVIGYGGAAGGGKGLALDTLLPTPSGFTTMGAVAEGDTLFDECGEYCTVVGVSEVSRRPCFRLTFDDGTTLVADDVHRWLTFDAKELAEGLPGTVRDTATLAQTPRTATGAANHALMAAAPGVRPLRYLVACDPVASVPTRCIAVDSPSRLYLATAACLPTHNTDLACGKALTHHKQVAIFRREATQLGGIIDRMAELLGGRDGFNGQEKVWRDAGPRGTQVVFGSVPNMGDERKHQGRPKDLLVIDEAANFLEAQVRFLMGWTRTTDPTIHAQTLMTFNPPTDAEGRWVVSYFAPWLDKKHPLYPAAPGRLIWVTTLVGKDDWSRPDDPRPFVLAGDQRVYTFDPKRYKPEEIVRPKSRTFIPSRISDNPYLMSTGYMTTLQSMPEPLRSQMLNGDFEAGMEDGAFQLYPTEWVEAAMARWQPLAPKPEMDSLGVDVARGGRDSTMLAPRHGHWYDRIKAHPGTSTPDGPTVAGLALAAARNGAVIHLDVIGVGASPYDFLVQANQDVIGVNVSEGSMARDMSGRLGFFNLRSQLGWQFREMLDPANDTGIALPKDSELLADLCAYSWRLRGSDIYVESREEIVKRIGRSPDRASAVILASMSTPKRRDSLAALNARQRNAAGYDPLQHLAGTHDTNRGTYDPYA